MHFFFCFIETRVSLYSPGWPRRHVDKAGLKFAAIFYVRIVGMHHFFQLFCFFFFSPFFVPVCAGALERWSVLSWIIWPPTSPLRVTYLPVPSVPGVLEPVLGAAMGLTLCPFPSMPSWGLCSTSPIPAQVLWDCVCVPPPAAPWSWSRQGRGRPHSCSCCCQGEPIPGLPPIHWSLLNAGVFSD